YHIGDISPRFCGCSALQLCQERAAAEGLGSCNKALSYLGQDYEALRQKCLQTGTLFKDEEFPACPSALGYQDLGPYSFKTQGIVWKRPTTLFINKLSHCGSCVFAGDCWLLAAIASLTLNPDVLHRVVPEAQSFQEDYAGIFHFQFWQYGEWVDVVVDDRLPTKNGELLFVHSEEGNEFWSALLEKAYAKLNGSYEALAGGSTIEGFEDFTGGISESYDLRRAPANLYQIVQKALRAGSLLGCSIDVTRAAETEAITSLKLVKGHAYSVTAAEEVYYRGQPEKLVRLRNPWGEVEWTGAWSDNAPEWNYIDPKQKQALDKQVDDGEFWMAFSDFQRQFTRLEICNLTPDTQTSNQVNKWDLTMFSGQWIRGSTAGGCQNYPATYWINPQFKIRLDEPDDDHEGGLNEPCCTILVGLMQKNRRRQKRMGEGLLSIGYSLYQVQFVPHCRQSGNIHLNRAFFTRNQPVARSETYINLREVSSRFKLPKGEYLIVPSTFEPYKNGEFCLRIFSEKKSASNAFYLNILNMFSVQDCEVTATELQTILNRVLAKSKYHYLIHAECSSEVRAEMMRHKVVLWSTIDTYTSISHPRISHMKDGLVTAMSMICVLPMPSGFVLNNQVQQSIAIRYACSKMTIDFDGFVACMIRLETLFKVFHLLDKEKSGVVRLSLAEVRLVRLMYYVVNLQ
uniref:Calpain 8 n=1 Tax=Phasianus colchicus TaxID=9054 RepID=A0A669P389_PHACC